jgi:predicted trehalose synthase
VKLLEKEHGKALKAVEKAHVEALAAAEVRLALFMLFSPELGLWVGTLHVVLQSHHQLMTASLWSL